MRIISKSADALYHAVLTELIVNGIPSSPRGRGTRESMASHLTLTNPNANVVTLRERKINYPFMIAEWLYILSGGNYADLITPFNKNIGNFAEGRHFAGAYGPKILEQIEYIRETLRADPDSRQAVLTIWRERPRSSKDVPCTVSMQFLTREMPGDTSLRRLHMIVYMRSNDAWLGLPYDLFNFTQIQRMLAYDLKIDVGNYHHMVGSLHLYDENKSAALRTINFEQPFQDSFAQAPFASFPDVEAVGALFDIAVQRPGVTPHFVGGWNAFDDQWKGYIETLCWRFNKEVEPRAPWSLLTTKR